MFKVVFLFFLLFLSQSADARQAPKAFKLCAACHTTAAEGQYRHAPSLNGIVGRKIASLPDFNYSERLRRETGIWTKEKLDAFIMAPGHVLHGTEMYFRGLKDANARRELIEWMANNTVPDILESTEIRERNNNMSADERTAHLIKPCTACHSFTKGEAARIGPNLWGVFGRPVASFPGYPYSERLMRKEGVWTQQTLRGFFMETKAFEKGSHLAFKNIHSLEDCDLIINFLQNLPSREAR